MTKTRSYGIVHFYDLVDIKDVSAVVEFLRADLPACKLQARVKVAKEGVNGWITGVLSDVEAYCAHLRIDLGTVFARTDFKISPCSEQQLSRGVKVWESGSVCKLLDEAEAYQELSSQDRAPHLSPQEWHERLEQGGDDLVLFDVRNFYETRIGHFDVPAAGEQGCRIPRIDPRTLSYEQVPDFLAEAENLAQFRGKTVMMYCTGGVRCERASTLLRSTLGGDSKVFQLEGGIHRYLESYPSGGFFQGSMYVFDRRRFVRGPDLLAPEAAVAVEACTTVVGECCIFAVVGETMPFEEFGRVSIPGCSGSKLSVMKRSNLEEPELDKGQSPEPYQIREEQY
ncbi:STR6 [Symbiodinium natans]|uniref:STR6 protein n=1 Tax=Symbiodinium natans TaxID=878477 RepID=A0A812IDA1_9DINO|nr:STR6 [Symbiodinium natans]